jgi:hypothetical protein
LKEKFMKAAAIDTQMSENTGSNLEQAMAHLKSVRDLHITDFDKKGKESYIAELGLEPRKCKGGRGGPQDKRQKKGGAGGAGGSLQLHGYSDQEWRALPEATQAKVNAGRAAEKAAKRATSVASLAKSADADKEKEAEKGGIKFGKGAHA